MAYQAPTLPQIDTRGAMNALMQASEKRGSLPGSLIDSYQNRVREEEKQKALLEQQAIQNRMAQEGLDLRKAVGEREASKYARDVAGDEALRTYTQQLGNYGSDVVPEADAMAIQKAYEANPKVNVQSLVDAAQNRYNADTAEGAQTRVDMLSNVAMPSGEYDPTKLIAMQSKAVAKPQGTLDSIVAAKAAEQVRQQGIKDRMNLAMFKESIKTVKPAAKEAEYNRLLKDGMDPTEARLLVWGNKSGKGSNDSKSSKTFSLDPKATDLDLDFFGSGDTQKAINIGQKLQDSFGLKTHEVTALLQQSVGGIINKSLETDKLAEALESSGLVKNSYYRDEKTGDIKAMTGTMMAEAIQNPDISIRTNVDGSRVFIDEGKEREKLRKLNKFNKPSTQNDIINVDNKATLPLGYYQ